MSPPSNRSTSAEPSENQLRSKRRVAMLAGILLLASVAFVVYQPCFKGGMILDDDLYITANGLIPAPNGLQAIWTSTEQAEYYPISYTTLWLEWRLWGLRPASYRIVNVLLHLTATVLLWATLRKLAIPGAYLASLLFLTHPVNVESVAWMFQVRGILATILFLLSILCYLNVDPVESLDRAHKAPGNRQHIWYWLSLFVFLLGMLSKGSVAVLPVVLLMIAWWQKRRISAADWLRSAPFFLIAAVLTGVNIWFQAQATSSGAIRNATFGQRLAGAGAAIWFYVAKALAPIHLLLVYPNWRIETDNLLWCLPLAAAVVFTALLLWKRNNSWDRPLLFAWAFFGVTMAPVLGFADVGFMKFSLVADHYQYIPLIAFTALIGAGWSYLYRYGKLSIRKGAIPLAVATVCLLMILGWNQSRLFGDPIALYRNTVDGNPDCWMVQNLLGNELARAGQSQEAIERYQETLRTNPSHAGAHSNLGCLLALAGDTQLGIEHLQKAIQLNPNLPDAHNNLGLVLVQMGRAPEAIEHYHQAILLKSDFVEAWTNLATANSLVGHPDEAIFAAQRAFEIATAHDQTALAQKIQQWLQAYRRRLANPPTATAPPNSETPQK